MTNLIITWFPFAVFAINGFVGMIWQTNTWANVIFKATHLVLAGMALFIFMFNQGYIVKVTS